MRPDLIEFARTILVDGMPAGLRDSLDRALRLGADRHHLLHHVIRSAEKAGRDRTSLTVQSVEAYLFPELWGVEVPTVPAAALFSAIEPGSERGGQ